MLILAGLLTHWGVRSVRKMHGINDFDCFYAAAVEAAARRPTIYEVRSREGRPFIYPPSAAVLLAPLGMPEFGVSALAFTLAKCASIGALLFSFLLTAPGVPRSRERVLVTGLLVALFAFRPIDNDMGNGQINILLAALVTIGVWSISARKRGVIPGAALVAAAAAIKLTPLIFILVPLMHRRWKGVAATVVCALLLLTVLPSVWFGRERLRDLEARYRERTDQLVIESGAGDMHASLHQLQMFTLSGLKADAVRYEMDGDVDPDSLPEPMTPAGARIVFLITSAVTGLGCLALRRRLRVGASPGDAAAGARDWAWDFAFACILSLLLSPLVRKAHLVILIPPLAFMLDRIPGVLRSPGLSLPARLKGDPAITFQLAALLILLFLADDLAIPVPFLPMPYHPAPFFALLTLSSLLITIRLRELPAPGTAGQVGATGDS